MIEGLRVTVDGEELALLCKDRAIQNLERAKEWAEKIVERQQNPVQEVYGSGVVTMSEMRMRREHYETDAAALEFLGNHIDASEKYLLGRDDLVKLGILSWRY